MNRIAALSNEDLMAEIRRVKDNIEDALAIRGPISGPRFVEARYYPHLIELERERNRRRAARRNAAV